MRDITYNDLISMSYKEIKDIKPSDLDYDIFDWSSHCYNPYEDNCDGRCQGASQCPLAKFFSSRMYGPSNQERPTNEEMINYFVKQKLNTIKRKDFVKTQEGKEFIEEFADDFKGLSEEDIKDVLTNRGEYNG